MKALTVQPGVKGSLAVVEVDEPKPADDELLVEGIVIGVCGTDHELNGGNYGWAPPGSDRLIIGHESHGRVLSAPAGSGFAEGDIVAGVVRRPDPVPCGACGNGEFDMCRNGQYVERGIKEVNGFASQRWVVKKDFVVKVAPELGSSGALMEPTSVVAKGWDQVDKVGKRGWFEPKSVVVTGAGPVGLLAALIGQERGLEVHVVDVMTEGQKPDLVKKLGGTYHSGSFTDILGQVQPDIVMETTGVAGLVSGALAKIKPYGIVCLLGMHDPQQGDPIDMASIGKQMVLDNGVVVGSVNANVGHWRTAADTLARAPQEWLASLISRTVPLSKATDAFERQPNDVKVLIDLQA